MTARPPHVHRAGAPAQWPAPLCDHLRHHNTAGLFGTPEWLALLAQTVSFGDGARADALVLQRADTPDLVLPLVLQGRRWQSLANYYSPLAVPSGADTAGVHLWHALFDGIAEQRPRPVALQLGPWPQELAQNPAVLQAAAQAGFWVAPHFRFGNWHWTVDDTWPRYWQRRDSAMRNTVQRKGRQLARAGGRIEILQTDAEVGQGLAAFQAVYADSWKSAEPHPDFMPGLIRLAAQQGWLRLGVAWLGDEAVAAQVWLVQGGTAHIYKLAYRERHADLGAGSVLTAALMQHVLEQDGVQEVDYGMGDEAYKQGWTPQRRERWALDCHHRRTWAGAGQMARARALQLLAPLRRRRTAA